MGIVNRSMDDSEQQRVENVNLRGTVTATSDPLFQVPQPCEIQSGKLGAVTLSGSPTCQLQIKRFVTGAGETLIPIGAALALVARSTSGPQSYTFSTTSLNSGDEIIATHAGANAAVADLNLALVLKATQDIKSWDF